MSDKVYEDIKKMTEVNLLTKIHLVFEQFREAGCTNEFDLYIEQEIKKRIADTTKL